MRRTSTRNARPLLVAVAVVVTASSRATPSPPSGGLVGLGRHDGVIGANPVVFEYDGTAGEQLNVGVIPGHTAYTPNPEPTVVDGDGNLLAPSRPANCGYCITVTFPTTARYRIILSRPPVINPELQAFTLVLNRDEHRGPAPVDAPTDVADLAQWLFYSYEGTAGEEVNVDKADLFAPDGTRLTTLHYLGDHLSLPVTGTYTMRVGTTRAILSHDIEAGPVTLGRVVTPPTLSGQRVRYTYEGVSGEALGLSETAVELRDPSGAVVVAAYGRPYQSRHVLPLTGTYTIILRASAWITPDVAGGALVVGDTPGPSLVDGQSVRYTHDGVIGEHLLVQVLDYEVSGIGYQLTFYGPDGVVIPQCCVGTQVDHTLTVAGTYVVVMTPAVGRTQDPSWLLHVELTPP